MNQLKRFDIRQNRHWHIPFTRIWCHVSSGPPPKRERERERERPRTKFKCENAT